MGGLGWAEVEHLGAAFNNISLDVKVTLAESVLAGTQG